MKESIIKVLKVAPGKRPELCNLNNDLSSLQEAVSEGAPNRGLIEIITLPDETCLLCNEEGKLIPLPPNRRLGRDIICGTFYLTGQDEEGDLTSLSAERVEYYAKIFGDPEDIDPAEAQAAFLTDFIVF